MSLAVLQQVYEETRRLAIAGSSVAPGDFRLKKLIPALEQAGAKSPVFAKLAQTSQALVESNEANASVALLELGTLINSILYTQGETGVEGKLEKLATIDMGLSRTQTPAKLLKPLLEALTTKGSGRMEVIRTSHEQRLFRDLRLIRPSVYALDDSYSEIADFIATNVLPLYGPAILPELEAQFNPNGKGGQPRRLLLMNKLDPVRARLHVKASLESGSKELRIAAIECLGTEDEDLVFLMDQVQAKAKDVRKAALISLSRLKIKDAEEVLLHQIDEKDLSVAIEALRMSASPRILTLLLARTREQIEKVLTMKPKVKSDFEKPMERLMQLLQCFTGRDDADSEALFAEILQVMTQLRSIKSSPSGEDICNLVAVNLSCGSKSMKKRLCKEHQTFSSHVMVEIFQAACDVLKPDDVFNELSPYLVAFLEGKRKKDEEAQKGQAIDTILTSYGSGHGYSHQSKPRSDIACLSNKWLELAIELEKSNLIKGLAALDKKKAQGPLLSIFDRDLNTKSNSNEFWELNGLLDTMFEIEHPKAIDCLIRLLQRISSATGYRVGDYHANWILRNVSSLPPDDILPKLEAILPTLSEKVAPSVIEQIHLLKIASNK